MVRFNPSKSRNAFTMIELIFAMVIISITVLALPLVLLQNADSQEMSLKQEGITLTSTKISQILTFTWDPLSSPLGVLMSTSNALDIAGGGAAPRVVATDFRVGHFQNELRRRMTPFTNPRFAGAIVGGGATGSINDFDGNVVTLGAPTARGFKRDFRLTTTVSYVAEPANYNATIIANNFGTASGTSNIKMVQIATDEQINGAWVPAIQLSSFSSNIGEAEFFKRRY